MSEREICSLLAWVEIGLALPVFMLLWFVSAPYGRHTRGGWGPTLSSRAAWMVMESPSCVGFALLFALGPSRGELVPLLLLVVWQLHYVDRTLVFPLRLRESGKRMPLAIAGMAIVFNSLNTYINARWISAFGSYPLAWLTDVRFVAGVSLFVAGFVINQKADAILLALRRPNETGYRVPQGFLYRWVSCPNYLGELLEWVGWAVATWSLAGAAFAIFTAANLVPRAVANHRWYQRTFADYPGERRALVPFVL